MSKSSKSTGPVAEFTTAKPTPKIAAPAAGPVANVSSMDQAVASFAGEFANAAYGEHVAIIVDALNTAKSDSKGMQSGLFAGFVALASTGVGPDVVRAAGNTVRAAVTEVMRKMAGFTPIKVKGSKESGAPVFTNATAYSTTVAQVLEFKRDHVNLFKVALDATLNETEVPALLNACGYLFEGISANKRLVAQCQALHDADMANKYPALFKPSTVESIAAATSATVESMTAERDILQAELIALRADIATMRANASRATMAHAG